MNRELTVGTELAGHRIQAVIGEGGQGVVYLAEHLRLGRKVALKVLNPMLAEDEQFRRRFIRESQLAAALDHPNIINIYDAGEVGGVLYISMRYVEGSDLSRVLRREGTVADNDAVTVLTQVAAALDVAHAEGLVHRDVKPGNILLGSANPVRRFKRVFLSDFGITKNLRGGGPTQSGQFLGTINYTAPEQILAGEIDGRADVYSLGCIMYQLLGGEVPFRRDGDVAVMYAHLQEPPPRLTSLRPDLASEMDNVVARAIAKQVDERFTTCTDLVRAAAAALGAPLASAEALTVADRPGPIPDHAFTHPLRAEADVFTEVVPTPRRRRRTRALVAAVTAAAAVTATVLLIRASGGHPEAGPNPTTPSSPTPARTGNPITDPNFPISWRQANHPATFGGPGIQAINRVGLVGSSIVAAGYEGSGEGLDPVIWRFDGVAWTKHRPPGGPGDQGIAAVVKAGPGLVAVGTDSSGPDTDGAVWTSEDGQFWDRVSPESAELGGPGDQSMRRAVPGGPGLIAVGFDSSDAAVWGSADGIHWTRVTNPEVFGGPGLQEMRSVIPYGSGLVAVGAGAEAIGGATDAAVWLLSGGTWTRVPEGELHAPGDQEMITLTAGGPGLVAVGYDDTGGDVDAAVWTSTDGTRWTRVRTDPTVFGGKHDQAMIGVGGVRGALVAVGYDDSGGDEDVAVWTSLDGRAWVRRSPSPDLGGSGNQRAKTLLYAGDELYAMGQTTASGGMDAAVWIGRIGG